MQMPSLSGMGGLPQLSMPGFGDLSMPSMGQMSMQGMQAQTAQTAKQSQAATTAAKMSATTTTSSELAEQEFFVPLRHIGRVITFFNVVPSSEETFFNHLLWFVFQSSNYTQITSY